MSFTRRPRVLKGALVAIESDFQGSVTGQNANIFVFQYNPEQLVRTLCRPDYEDAPLAQEKAGHKCGSPVQNINLTLELDATDQLEKPEQHPHAIENGLHPSLAALEMMMYPRLPNGSAELPVVLFLWGPRRTMPVRLTSLEVTEEAFDQNLNPIRAKIDLCMRVLRHSELRKGSIGYQTYNCYLKQKESLADLNRQTSLAQAENSAELLKTFLAE